MRYTSIIDVPVAIIRYPIRTSFDRLRGLSVSSANLRRNVSFDCMRSLFEERVESADWVRAHILTSPPRAHCCHSPASLIISSWRPKAKTPTNPRTNPKTVPRRKAESKRAPSPSTSATSCARSTQRRKKRSRSSTQALSSMKSQESFPRTRHGKVSLVL